jgi:hypothetical protein
MPLVWATLLWTTSNAQRGYVLNQSSSRSKDNLYKNLIKILRDEELVYPSDHKLAPKFEMQMLEMIKEYKGEFLSCHHPDRAGAHDDFPDSLALALYQARKITDLEINRGDLGL